MFAESMAVIQRPDIMRPYSTDERARIHLKEDVLRNTDVMVVAKRIEEIPEENITKL
jgi:hypothetical protein